jgi:hypothetical protein
MITSAWLEAFYVNDAVMLTTINTHRARHRCCSVSKFNILKTFRRKVIIYSNSYKFVWHKVVITLFINTLHNPLESSLIT